MKRFLTVLVSHEVSLLSRGQVSCLSIKSFLYNSDSGSLGEAPLAYSASVNVVYISCCHAFHYVRQRTDEDVMSDCEKCNMTFVINHLGACCVTLILT